MPVTLKFQSSGTVPGNAMPVQMSGGSLTVGRGPANDMVLPDPDRLLSKSHFVIEDHNGKIMIVDLSTNGTFLNYSKIPLGRTPTQLNNGDVLGLGSYELVIEITEEIPDLDDLMAPPASATLGDAARAPDPMDLLDAPEPGGDFLDELLGSPAGPTGPSQLNPVDPIDELLPPLGDDEDPFFQKPDDGRGGTGASLPAHTPAMNDAFAAPSSDQNLIPDDWDDLLGPAPEAATPEDPNPVAPPAPVEEPVQRRTPPSLPRDPDPAPPQAELPEETVLPAAPETPAPVAPPPIQPVQAAPDPAPASEAARAFLSAVGAEEVHIADEELTTTMARMGRVMRSLVTGLREILMTRTSIKSEFRIEQTMIGAGGNNPLKFSISPDQAIEAMVRPNTKGYLGAETAAQQALDDIKAHEVAMVTGMEAALKGVLEKLNPEKLTDQIETSSAFGSLWKGKKARYWEVYEKIYAEISDQAENDFHDLFSREFARAYKEQLDKLKS